MSAKGLRSLLTLRISAKVFVAVISALLFVSGTFAYAQEDVKGSQPAKSASVALDKHINVVPQGQTAPVDKYTDIDRIRQTDQDPVVNTPKMPDFTSQPTTYDDAVKALQRLHSSPRRKESGSSPDHAAGTIYDQKPLPGTDLKGRPEIILYVSTGPSVPEPSPPPPEQQPPTPVPPPPQNDVSVTTTLDTSKPYSAGMQVDYTIIVRNAGPSPATHVKVVESPVNLVIASISGACGDGPCVIDSIEPGASAVVRLTATISAVGAFKNTVEATPEEADPIAGNNSATRGDLAFASTTPPLPTDTFGVPGAASVAGQSSTVATPPSTPRQPPVQLPVDPLTPGTPLWTWLLLAAVALVGLLASAELVRRWQWPRHVKMRASLDRTGASSSSPLSMETPSIGLESFLDTGTAGPLGPVPVTGVEVRHVR